MLDARPGTFHSGIVANPKEEPKPSLNELIARGEASRARLDRIIQEMKDLEREVERTKKAVAKKTQKSK